MEHDFYKTSDKNVPHSICDKNGEVVLALCKRCGKAERELTERCSNAVRRTIQTS